MTTTIFSKIRAQKSLVPLVRRLGLASQVAEAIRSPNNNTSYNPFFLSTNLAFISFSHIVSNKSYCNRVSVIAPACDCSIRKSQFDCSIRVIKFDNSVHKISKGVSVETTKAHLDPPLPS